MHKLIRGGVSGRRAVGVAAALVVAGGLAGAATLMPASAQALPLIATDTSIAGTTQLLVDPGIPPVLKVDVSVTAKGGTTAPSGNVVVSTGSYNCTAALGSSNTLTSTGSCNLHGLPYGSYSLKAEYKGAGQLSDSVSGWYSAAVGQAPSFTADGPGLSARGGHGYSYTFAAKGVPAPKYALASGAPSWLHINSSTGQVYAWVPWGAGSFTYSVVASNAVGSSTAGPFTVSTGRGNGSAQVETSLNCTRHVVTGQWGTCALTVTNDGSGIAYDVNAAIQLPGQLTTRFCGWWWWNGHCRDHGNVTNWSIGQLAPGQTQVLKVHFTARFFPRWERNNWVRVNGDATWRLGNMSDLVMISNSHAWVNVSRFWWLW